MAKRMNRTSVHAGSFCKQLVTQLVGPEWQNAYRGIKEQARFLVALIIVIESSRLHNIHNSGVLHIHVLHRSSSRACDRLE